MHQIALITLVKEREKRSHVAKLFNTYPFKFIFFCLIALFLPHQFEFVFDNMKQLKLTENNLPSVVIVFETFFVVQSLSI
jgi:hypothetical protein